MASVPISIARSPKRYAQYNLNAMVNHLNEQSVSSRLEKVKKIQQDRKMNVSCSQMAYRQPKPIFNNKMKDGVMLDADIKSVPYLFIPKYKNQTFIMPDRVFAKGKAGKRFQIQIKDSSVFSFRSNQSVNMGTLLRKREKEQTIHGRKMEELNRILDRDDGKCRSTKMKSFFQGRNKLNATSVTSEVFSRVDPMLEFKDFERVIHKKTNLNRTFAINLWRPNSQSPEAFSQTVPAKFNDKFSQFNASVR